MAEDSEVLLSARGVCKAFGPTRALIDVDIDVRRGEIRGLIGENGSGKSTLSAIAAGALSWDEGTFTLKGGPYTPRNMVDAQNRGISMVIQEMGTIPRITVASNIYSGRLEQFRNRLGLLNWSRINREADAILADIGAPGIKGSMMIDQLNFEDRKIVEIARAVVVKPDLLIIDETTTALAQKGRTIIYNLIERMHRENKAVLFISHDLDELMQVCNTITVLRDGVIIGTLSKENMSVDMMRSMMVGRELSGSYYRADYDGSCGEEVVLTARQVTLSPYFENIDLELHKGEILGFGGLSNCGMHELGRVL
jgi:ribose transport system ATP-binding protein